MKKALTLLLLCACMVCAVQAQTYNQMDENGNITQRNEYDNNSNFNPNKRDSTASNKEIPIGVRAFTVNQFGDVQPAELDTIPHLYQNSIYATGLYGEYNTLGTNYTARLNRIFADRPELSEFYFVQPYSFITKEPEDFLFINTLSPYTNITYEDCGNKQNGEDHIDAKFAINANKRLGFGFDLDYHYALGYYSNQNNSNFRTTLFSSYLGDKYQMNVIGTLYHRKATESGGIVNDDYILHPEKYAEQYTEEEIPTVLEKNYNRNNSQHLFLTHRYNIGFYRKVKMTDEEIKARQFAQKSAKQKKDKEREGKDEQLTSGRPDNASGRPQNATIAGDEPAREMPSLAADTTRIKVDSQAKLDSLLAEKARQDSIDETMKKVFIPVTSFIHTLDYSSYQRIYQAYETPTDYYANTYYNYSDNNEYGNDSIYDKTRFQNIRNMFAIALMEGFNKYMKAGLKVFAAHTFRKYEMPDLTGDSTTYFMNKWTEQDFNIGGQISKTQGRTLHFNLEAEMGLLGASSGDIAATFETDLNFPLFGDTVRLAAMAHLHRQTPTFFQESYHSKHVWWDRELEKEILSHIEGTFSYEKTNTRLRVAMDNIRNYTYFGMSYDIDEELNRHNMTASIYQASGNTSVFMAQLYQNFRLGILNWENVVTYQKSSDKNVIPLPEVNVFSNLFLKFKIARVLSVELGGCATYFTKYYAPDYMPMISQYAVQMNGDSRVELGGYPFVDVYANMHLKRTRFFLSMSHINAGSGTRNQFLTPHYPTNNRIFRFGVSWNFFN